MSLVFPLANTDDQTIQLDFPCADGPMEIVDNSLVRYVLQRVRMITVANTRVDSVRPDDRRMRDTLSGLDSKCTVTKDENVLSFYFDAPASLFGHEGVKRLMLCHSMFPTQGTVIIGCARCWLRTARTSACPVCRTQGVQV